MRYILPALFALSLPAFADEATVEHVEIQKSSDSYRFNVTLRHGDTGWEDYADGWRVEDADGNVLGTRVLHHPHVNEQPFTRSLAGVQIPDHLAEIYIRAKTLTEGWGTETTAVSLPE
ncbi:hypothetical protein [Thalassobius sp. I31.1]|uniref:hypothetical protein n=1 Tax=Thalassobius sp. I31.1 TaxID=2109912 RepID=UPI000D1AA33A|nr:hypothetical protein [Thalassobius sp. I31.1]